MASECCSHEANRPLHIYRTIRTQGYVQRVAATALFFTAGLHKIGCTWLIVLPLSSGSQQSAIYDTVTYLLTPWCRVLLEKLTGLQLVKKFPAFHGTRRFITALTSVRHLSLSWASPIQSIYPHPTSSRSVLILSTHLHLGLPIIYLLTYSMVQSFSRS